MNSIFFRSISKLGLLLITLTSTNVFGGYYYWYHYWWYQTPSQPSYSYNYSPRFIDNSTKVFFIYQNSFNNICSSKGPINFSISDQHFKIEHGGSNMNCQNPYYQQQVPYYYQQQQGVRPGQRQQVVPRQQQQQVPRRQQQQQVPSRQFRGTPNAADSFR